MSLAQLKGTLEKEHISFDQFRENTKRQIIVAKLQSQEVVNKISITEQEIKNFLAKDSGRLGARAEVHLLHILIATPDGATAEVIQRARAQADQVVQELRRGADFAAVAVRQSGGRQALEGGDLGWLRAGQIPVQVKELVQTMDKGSISDPLRGSEGFHIFKLVDYKGGNRQVVDQTHVRHILVKTNDQVNEQDARTRLEQLRIRLVGGEDFAALARSHSDDPVSAVKGGDLGWLSPGDTVPEFEHQITELRAGDFSQPFRSPQGWHLVQVVERRSHDNTDESMKQKAREAIKERKSNEEIELWLRRLRDESYVEIRLPEAGKPESGRP
jgi:peptidyl-prolyl cis-trans isomerase SurA